LDEDQVALVVRSWVVPSVNVPLAVKDSVCPTERVVGVWGDTVSVKSCAAVTTTFALAEPLRDAVIVADPSLTLRTGKSAPSAPAGMGTVAGTVAAVVLLLVSETVWGCVDAGDTDTCRTPGVPLGTVMLPGVKPVTTVDAAVTCTVALADVELMDAVTVALPRIKPMTGKVTVVWPARTVALAGALSTLGALFVNGMTVSEGCVALIVRVKVPVAPC